MRACLRGAALGALRGAELELVPGRYVALSSEREPLAELVTVLCGREAPRRGLVHLDDAAPSSCPALRRKVASLLAEEALPPADAVRGSVEKALRARGAPPLEAAKVLEDAGLSHLAELRPESLGPRETRSVALALALAHGGAELFALYEPLATLLPATHVLPRLDEHTSRGALVVAATTSPADATLLGGAWLCVELGRVRATPGPAPRLGVGPWQQVTVETPDARRLAQLLHESPYGLSSELGASAQALKITGPALDLTVREVISLSRVHGVEITRIEAAVPPVEALMAARAGFARGAYEASRIAAQAALSPQPPRGAS